MSLGLLVLFPLGFNDKALGVASCAVIALGMFVLFFDDKRNNTS